MHFVDEGLQIVILHLTDYGVMKKQGLVLFLKPGLKIRKVIANFRRKYFKIA